MGAALAQYIPEQNLFEFSGGDMGLLDVSGDLHRLTGGGGVQQGLGLGHVEPGTCLLRRDGVGGGVIACVFHAAGHGVVDALGGEGLGGQNRGVHIHRAIGLGGEGIPDGLLQIRLGHRQTVQFPGHRQAVLAHLIRGVLSGTGEGLGQLRELLTKHSPGPAPDRRPWRPDCGTGGPGRTNRPGKSRTAPESGHRPTGRKRCSPHPG